MTILDFFFSYYHCSEEILNISLLCVFSAETDSLQTQDNNHNSQQHQQQHNLFPSLDQNRYTRTGGAKEGKQF